MNQVLADPVTGTDGDDNLEGSDNGDDIEGKGGDDRIDSKGGNDRNTGDKNEGDVKEYVELVIKELQSNNLK